MGSQHVRADGDESEQPRTADSASALALDLQALRAANGTPSYAELVARIGRARLEDGVPASAATPSRTTVYDAFRVDRARIDPRLVGEIVHALTGEPAEAGQWRDRAAHANAAPRLRAAQDRTSVAPVGAAAAPPRIAVRLLIVVGTVAGCLAFYELLVIAFAGSFPLYLDMIAVAVIAMLFGPWWGALAGVLATSAAVGIATLIDPGTSAAGFWFVAVQITGALVWGYGIRSWRLGRTFGRFLLLGVITGIACTLVAVPVIAFAYPTAGDAFSTAVAMQAALEQTTAGILPALFSTNLLLSLADKTVTGIIALIVVTTLLRRWAPSDLLALTAPFRGGR